MRLVVDHILQVDVHVWVQFLRDLRLAATAAPAGCGPSLCASVTRNQAEQNPREQNPPSVDLTCALRIRLSIEQWEEKWRVSIKFPDSSLASSVYVTDLSWRAPWRPPPTKLINKAIQHIICTLRFLFFPDTSCFHRTAGCWDPNCNEIWVK